MNQYAKALVVFCENTPAYALERTACEFGLKRIGHCYGCRILYRANNGKYVNLWIDGSKKTISRKRGGLGFDSDVDVDFTLFEVENKEN